MPSSNNRGNICKKHHNRIFIPKTLSTFLKICTCNLKVFLLLPWPSTLLNTTIVFVSTGKSVCLTNRYP